MSYGYNRANFQRHPAEHPSLGVLRSKGLGVVPQHDGSFMIAGSMLYWPTQDFWRNSDGSKLGYGVEKLTAAVLPALVIDNG